MESTLDKKTEAQRKSGSLNLFAPSFDGMPDPQPYVRFKVCRGFIDDLNRMLPIRVRIEMETRIASGSSGGEIRSPQGLYRWEFRPA
jgi:hypothetical protein